jgi:UTP--glucose-1-phosphate uridylyltransferase
MPIMHLTTLEDAARELAPCGYDPALQNRFATRATHPADNAVKGTLAPLPAGAITRLPPLSSPERARLRAKGLKLVADGKVGALVLAGGMATRFGGVVKAVVEAYRDQGPPRSFLEAKHDDLVHVSEHVGAPIPMLVMSSFATHDAITRHIAD